MFRAVAKQALAEPLFARPGKTLGRGKVAGQTAESAAELFVDLADLDDLFQGGADEVGEALPGVFPKGAESWVRLPGSGEPWIPSGGRIAEHIIQL